MNAAPTVASLGRPRLVPLALGAAVLIAALWSAAWLLAARQADRGFAAWLQAEATDGRQWTCPERRVEGYPLALVVRCDRPTFRGEIAGHIAAGIVEGLAARVGVDRPGTIQVGLASPMNLRAEDGTFALEVSWRSLTVELPGVTQPPDRGALAASRLAVTLSTRDAGDLNLRADTLSGSAGPGSERPGDKAFAFDAAGVSFPTVDPIPGLDAPADAAGHGVLSHADLLQAPTVGRLEAWRRADGRLALAALSVRVGSFAGTASGMLGLDPLHRAAGRLETSLSGFEPIARRYGIPLAGVQIGGMLTNLIAGGKAPHGAPGDVQLPLILADGRIAIGPFATGLQLVPVY